MAGGCTQGSGQYLIPFCGGAISDAVSFGPDFDGSPAIQLHADLQPVDLPRSEIESIGVRVLAGGIGTPYGAAGQGAELEVWQAGTSSWIALASTTNGPAQPNLVSWASQNLLAAQRFVSGTDLFLRALSANPSGSHPTNVAAISVNYAEVVIRHTQSDVVDPAVEQSFAGTIFPATERDVLRVELTSNRYLIADTSGPQCSGDLDLALANSSGVVLGTVTTGPCPRLDPNLHPFTRLAPGIYFLEVSAAAGTAAIDSYSIRVRTIVPDVCGNGVLETGESCDDGNTTPGDGCSPTCQ
jgi:cysteine-rich repeat protein